jgi:drug/metabolite transporter (DMT)-like permease
LSRWRPSPAEERWLAVASELGAAVPRGAIEARTGGWRSTGPLARIALFALGLLASALLLGVLGFSDEDTLLVAGLIAALAAEWLTVRKRLFASGVEEGMTLGGFLMIGLWFALTVVPEPRGVDASFHELVLVYAVGAAGLRRLNPFVTTCAAVTFLHWVSSTYAARSLDESIGTGVTAFVAGCALAATALALSAREYRRPSHDRMLDWLVAVLPITAYARYASLGALGALDTANATGATRPLVVALLSAVGAALLATGLRRRRQAPLWGFLGCVAALAVELRAAVPVAPETWLISCGLIALFAGVALDRWLREPRNGLTSQPLTHREGPLDLLQLAGAALLAQRSTPAPRPVEAGFEGGGGRFGGGGASGGY